jgi:hypothetical protein
MVKFRFTVSTGGVGCAEEEILTLDDIGLNESEWSAMTEDEQMQYLDQEWQYWSEERIDGGPEIIKPDESGEG